MQNIQSFIKKMDQNQRLAAIAIIGIIIVGGLAYANQNGGISLSGIFGSSNQAIAQNSVDYINNNKLSQTPATLVEGSVTEESGLVKFKISIGGNAFDSYATKDGKLLMPQAFNLTGASTATGTGTANTPAATAKPADLKKTDNPMLEAYVVADCPFGLQMQRAMASAIAAQPALANNLTVRYIGAVSGNTITAMHGPKEAEENLRQICIRDEQKSKYWAYVSCYMQKSAGASPNGMPYGDSATCLKTAGIDTAKLNACVTDTKRGVAYAAEDFKLSDKFGVTGSPTLILGDVKVSEFDFGGRSPESLKSIICAASTTPSAFCSTKLDETQAATSFSVSYASAAGATASAANCAPVTQ